MPDPQEAAGLRYSELPTEEEPPVTPYFSVSSLCSKGGATASFSATLKPDAKPGEGKTLHFNLISEITGEFIEIIFYSLGWVWFLSVACFSLVLKDLAHGNTHILCTVRPGAWMAETVLPPISSA